MNPQGREAGDAGRARKAPRRPQAYRLLILRTSLEARSGGTVMPLPQLPIYETERDLQSSL